MTREQKTQLITEWTAKLTEAPVVYVADISNLDAGQTVNLRRACFKADVKISVVKNTLLNKAMENSEKNFDDLPSVLKGSSSVLISDIGNAPAKVIKEFRKKSDRPILKGAYVGENVYLGDDQLEALVNIKSKNELIADIVTLLQSPAKNIISALQSGGQQLSGIVQTLSDR